MQVISSTQIKMARALLGWSQDYMAIRTGLSITTIRKAEDDYVPRGKTAEIILNTLLEAGCEFTEQDGVRRMANTHYEINGQNSINQFIEDMIQTVRKESCDIYSIMFSKRMFQNISDPAQQEEYERFQQLTALTNIKCIFPLDVEPEITLPFLEYQTIPKVYLGAVQFFSYGSKAAIVDLQGKDDYGYIVHRMPSFSQKLKMHFFDFWNNTSLLKKDVPHSF